MSKNTKRKVRIAHLQKAMVAFHESIKSVDDLIDRISHFNFSWK